jgi:hypothetical protein
MISIPSFHVSTPAAVRGSASVFIQNRKDGSHTGVFSLRIDASFKPSVSDYPTFGAILLTVDLNQSLKASITATSIELINLAGNKRPTIYLTGRCDVQSNEQGVAPKGCKYWLTIADNTLETPAGLPPTPDIIGFAIMDNLGNEIAQGTGPVKSGDMRVFFP